MLPEITELLHSKGLLGCSLTLYDAFCGSGSVANALKGHCNIVAGDMLNWCVVYTSGRLFAHKCTFEKLGFEPFEYLNKNNDILEGFFYENYSPGGSERMYFTAENAGRIDFFRAKIEEWFQGELITKAEYNFLLASLIESVSDISNTAGVYGAFLKKWDPRALKPIIFHSVDINAHNGYDINFVVGKAEEVAAEVNCDIIYIDPPYTQNQYGTQYHIFETLVLNDNPPVSKITGSRPVTPMRSDWSKQFKANILFDKLIATTKAKYILFSYNSDGFLSKEYILACLKRYCLEDSIDFRKIPYKKYRNFKTKSEDEHFEYLFFAQKKAADDVVYESPLNYIGSKSLIVPIIREHLPNGFSEFIDAFGGGLNVGINVSADTIIYNDLNKFAMQLVESFKNNDTYEYLMFVQKIIKKFGLEAGEKEAYNNARDYYNSFPVEKRDPRLLFTVIMYGFQQQLRFNSHHDFNNPVGMRWLNDCVLEKFISFSRMIKSKNIVFKATDFTEVKETITRESFVYMDPPYRLTTGSYNDGKRGFEGWTIEHERKMCAYAEMLSDSGVKFMISYVLAYAGQINEELTAWCERHNFNVVQINEVPRRRPRKEVLITNYGYSN